jgi:hypothetical protein
MPREEVIEAIQRALPTAGFTVQPATLADAEAALHREHIRNTRIIEL